VRDVVLDHRVKFLAALAYHDRDLEEELTIIEQTRKQLAKRSKAARKEFKQARRELHKNTKAAYKDLAATFAKEQPKKRRR